MCLPVPNLLLCHWPSQLFNLRTPLSTDVPVLLLNQPIVFMCADILLALLSQKENEGLLTTHSLHKG